MQSVRTVAQEKAMSLFRKLALAALGAGLLASPVLADPPREADRAFRAQREGRAMPLPKIERRVMPMMGGADYLGPELNGDRLRMKFVKDGRVIWVDVDPESGRIVGRSRP
jgi:hypothetical protein